MSRILDDNQFLASKLKDWRQFFGFLDAADSDVEMLEPEAIEISLNDENNHFSEEEKELVRNLSVNIKANLDGQESNGAESDSDVDASDVAENYAIMQEELKALVLQLDSIYENRASQNELSLEKSNENDVKNVENSAPKLDPELELDSENFKPFVDDENDEIEETTKENDEFAEYSAEFQAALKKSIGKVHNVSAASYEPENYGFDKPINKLIESIDILVEPYSLEAGGFDIDQFVEGNENSIDAFLDNPKLNFDDESKEAFKEDFSVFQEFVKSSQNGGASLEASENVAIALDNMRNAIYYNSRGLFNEFNRDSKNNNEAVPEEKLAKIEGGVENSPKMMEKENLKVSEVGTENEKTDNILKVVEQPTAENVVNPIVDETIELNLEPFNNNKGAVEDEKSEKPVVEGGDKVEPVLNLDKEVKLPEQSDEKKDQELNDEKEFFIPQDVFEEDKNNDELNQEIIPEPTPKQEVKPLDENQEIIIEPAPNQEVKPDVEIKQEEKVQLGTKKIELTEEHILNSQPEEELKSEQELKPEQEFSGENVANLNNTKDFNPEQEVIIPQNVVEEDQSVVESEIVVEKETPNFDNADPEKTMMKNPDGTGYYYDINTGELVVVNIPTVSYEFAGKNIDMRGGVNAEASEVGDKNNSIKQNEIVGQDREESIEDILRQELGAKKEDTIEGTGGAQSMDKIPDFNNTEELNQAGKNPSNVVDNTEELNQAGKNPSNVIDNTEELNQSGKNPSNVIDNTNEISQGAQVPNARDVSNEQFYSSIKNGAENIKLDTAKLEASRPTMTQEQIEQRRRFAMLGHSSQQAT